MPLPNKLSDLFPSPNDLPATPKASSLSTLGYTITWDALDDGTAPPELSSQLAGLYDASRHHPDRALAERLRQLVQQYPNVPVLKNYLMTTYVLTGQKSRGDAVLEQTIQQHPRYLLGLVNKANQLLVNGDTDAVEALFGGPLTGLGQLYPERSVFQASEVGHFSMAAFNYFLEKGNTEEAENRLRLMRDLQYHTIDQLRTMKNRLDMARMEQNLAKMQAGFEESISIDGYFRADDRQTTEPPLFEHPEMQWLYAYGLIETSKPLPVDKRDILLALPRPSLTRDLSKVLLDTVYRYEFFNDQDWEDSQHNFAGHALLLATELRADECLEAVLETLRQDSDFQEFWWGDWLNDFYEPYFRSLLPARASELQVFMREADINTYAKEVVLGAYVQEALANPALKPVAQTWLTDLFTFLLDHAEDEHLLDTDLNAWLIGAMIDLHLTDLLPLIQTAFERRLVSENIQGNLSDVEQELLQQQHPVDRHPLRPLAEQYAYLHDPVAYRKAHPDPERQKISDELMSKMEAKDDEWAFLYDDEEEETDELPNGALFPSGKNRFLPQEPIIKQPAPNRNDKVSVRYTDGKVVRDVKYKKVESDVEAGKCELL